MTLRLERVKSKISEATQLTPRATCHARSLGEGHVKLILAGLVFPDSRRKTLVSLPTSARPSEEKRSRNARVSADIAGARRQQPRQVPCPVSRPFLRAL